jgi:hypothetical protein
LLIWFTSGVLMSYLPIEQVRGEHLVDRAQAAQFPKELKLVDPTTIAA